MRRGCGAAGARATDRRVRQEASRACGAGPAASPKQRRGVEGLNMQCTNHACTSARLQVRPIGWTTRRSAPLSPQVRLAGRGPSSVPLSSMSVLRLGSNGAIRVVHPPGVGELSNTSSGGLACGGGADLDDTPHPNPTRAAAQRCIDTGWLSLSLGFRGIPPWACPRHRTTHTSWRMWQRFILLPAR